MIEQFLFSFIVLVLSFLGLSWFAGSDAPYVPTEREKIKKVLKASGVNRGKTFYELGSGDGRVVLEAARLGAKSIGIEQSLLRVLYSRFMAKKHSLNQVFFYHGNIFDRNYLDADVVYIYLLQHAVDQLENKLKKELRKNAVVITQKYHFKNCKPYIKIGDFWLYRS